MSCHGHRPLEPVTFSPFAVVKGILAVVGFILLLIAAMLRGILDTK